VLLRRDGIPGSRWPRPLAAVGLSALLGACGGGGSPSYPSASPSPAATPPPSDGGPTITIGASGVSPKETTVGVGERVTFANQDAVPHEMASDPHPTHGNCPAINQVSALAPGQSRQTGTFTAPGECGFHDHGNPSDTSLQGTIVIR